jgi:prophage antirepressor-like protein
MANEEPKRWEQQLREAAARAEEEARRVVNYINDEVVPDIRRNGSQALRAAAAELQKLAQRMDDQRAASTAQAPPASTPETPTRDKGEAKP